MSLVGSLEDLGLSDILQIVMLARKSGWLLLRSKEGEGRIVFREGRVHGASVESEVGDLRALLVDAGHLSAEDFERAADRATEQDLPLDEAIEACSDLSAAHVDSLRRERVERAVLRMFSWNAGEFSFEITDEEDAGSRDLRLRTGINSQYLMMEAARLGDESLRTEPGAGADDAPDGSELAADEGSGEAVVPAEDAADDDAPTLSDRPISGPGEADPATTDASGPDRDPTVEMKIAPEVAGDGHRTPEPEPAPPGAPARPRSLIVIEPELRVLAWIKAELSGLFDRIHVFQRADLGVTRIRQYLGRGELPWVMVAAETPPDPLTGARDAGALVVRLRGLTPRMRIFTLRDGASPSLKGLDRANGEVLRPEAQDFATRHAPEKLAASGERLREALRPWLTGEAPQETTSPAAAAAGAAPSLRAFADPASTRVIERLRDDENQGDVLALVLDFAGQQFPRAAIFAVRDGDAIGGKQRGLASAGGPDDDAFANLRFSTGDAPWFRTVLETRNPLQAVPSEADRPLAERLGADLPAEVYLAPIVSRGEVAAILYVDRLPASRPIGDTSTLADVVREAGLSLERALARRDARDDSEPPG
jgi:hypothetical protein